MMLTVFVGCSDKKAPTKQKKEYTFSHQDSIEVLNLVNEFIANMEKDDIPAAINMLSILKGDSLIPMEPIQQRRQAIALNMIKGVKYDVDYMMFRSDRNNEVKVDITLFEKDENDPKPNKTAFFFRPIRQDGKWLILLTAKMIQMLSLKGLRMIMTLRNKLLKFRKYEKNEDYFGWCSADAEFYSYGPGHL